MMTDQVLDVSVVICAYTERRWKALVQAVNSVRCQSLPASEIIIVIDHNPTLLKRAQQEFTDATIIGNDLPQGDAGSRNCGMLAAQAQIVAFLDDDAVADVNWLRELVRGYRDGQVIGVGGSILPSWEQGRPAWFPSEFDWVVGCTYRGMPTTTSAIRNLIGANMSFRRSALVSVGGFRDSMARVGASPMGCHETELCIRLLQTRSSSTLLHEPRAIVSHHVPASRAKWSYFRARCWAEGLSKANMSKYVGLRDGLASERSYTLRVLPNGLLQGLRDSLQSHSPKGIARSIAIASGLAVTTAGYISGRVRGRAKQGSTTMPQLQSRQRAAL